MWNEIKMLSLCLPFMGFACGKSPLMRVLLFSGKPFEASQENKPSPSKSHYGKTKYGDKIDPCGRKKRLAHLPPFAEWIFYDRRELFWIIFCLWHIPILGTRMIICLWMGVENVLCHSHKTIQKQSIKPKGSEYDKVFWSYLIYQEKGSLTRILESKF